MSYIYCLSTAGIESFLSLSPFSPSFICLMLNYVVQLGRLLQCLGKQVKFFLETSFLDRRVIGSPTHSSAAQIIPLKLLVETLIFQIQQATALKQWHRYSGSPLNIRNSPVTKHLCCF